MKFANLATETINKIVMNPLIHDTLVRALKLYFRLECVGLENIPKKGGSLIIPNHSGFAGLDAIILTHEIASKTKRWPRVMTHHLWFLSNTTGIPAQNLGFIEASTANGIKALHEENLVILFPEGEKGNFKASINKYQLQEFKRGFVRWAIETQTPIIPTLIIGAEESQITLAQLKLPRLLKNLILPLPLNLIPLPARWKIVFLPPIELPYPPESASDNTLVHDITQDIHQKMQAALIEEINKRKTVYI